MATNNLLNLPAELRSLPRWVVATQDKIPLNPRTGAKADVTNPATWGTFEEARHSSYQHVGFVLGDGYAAIDLDAPADDAMTDRHTKIFDLSESYAEISQSGNGVHILCKGTIPHGVRRDKVEVYSNSRYFICTGNVLKQLPVNPQQDLLDTLFREMAATEAVGLVETAMTIEDDELLYMAEQAVNAAKFNQLWEGNWQGDWPSQSEADFALMSMLAYYSKSNEQCRRLFRFSKLGQRDKAMRDRYLDYMLTKCRAKEPPPVDLGLLRENARVVVSASAATRPLPPPPPKIYADAKRPADTVVFPPGLVGELADYFMASAIRPVREIALVTALALVAGVAGRSFNVSGTGLNLYLILLANTGSGKEEPARSIDAIIARARQKVPMADRFIGPAVFASGQALVRVLDVRPCFVSVLGEVGVTLQQLCDPRAPGPTLMLKKVLLDLYGKSGFNQVLRESVYSDHEKNTKIIQAPNITILGESTPDVFYGGLDAGHIVEGLVPRFSVMEYTGPRPARNPNAFQPAPDDLVDRLADLLAVALTTQQNNTFCAVTTDPAAKQLLDGFDREADSKVNDSASDVDRHLWNRAHLKALKLGALIAVGCNQQEPTVMATHAQWAIDFVRREVVHISAKYQTGEVGRGESRQESDLRFAIRDYLTKLTPTNKRNYKVPESMLDEPFIPYHYLRRRLRLVASFKDDRKGFNNALDSMLEAMVKAGDLVLVNPREAHEKWRVNSPVYAVGATFHEPAVGR